jgi:hypothetical protein
VVVRSRSLFSLLSLLAGFEDALGLRLLPSGLFLGRRAARKGADEQQPADGENPNP